MHDTGAYPAVSRQIKLFSSREKLPGGYRLKAKDPEPEKSTLIPATATWIRGSVADKASPRSRPRGSGPTLQPSVARNDWNHGTSGLVPVETENQSRRVSLEPVRPPSQGRFQVPEKPVQILRLSVNRLNATSAAPTSPG